MASRLAAVYAVAVAIAVLAAIAYMVVEGLSEEAAKRVQERDVCGVAQLVSLSAYTTLVFVMACLLIVAAALAVGQAECCCRAC